MEFLYCVGVEYGLLGVEFYWWGFLNCLCLDWLVVGCFFVVICCSLGEEWESDVGFVVVVVILGCFYFCVEVEILGEYWCVW